MKMSVSIRLCLCGQRSQRSRRPEGKSLRNVTAVVLPPKKNKTKKTTQKNNNTHTQKAPPPTTKQTKKTDIGFYFILFFNAKALQMLFSKHNEQF